MPRGKLGIFVGGASSRMGGRPKGLLCAKDTGEPLVVRLARLGREADLEPVWVGCADPYRELVPGLGELRDEPAGIGPLGGLHALLRAAEGAPVIALACDMPQITHAFLMRLLSERPDAAVLAPRSEAGLWEPLCARYDAPSVLAECARAIAQGERALQRLLARVAAVELTLSRDERAALIDWDAPEDLARS